MEAEHKLRWFQFSLRTLLVAVGIVAVQCAVCLPALRKWHERRSEQEGIKRIIDALDLHDRKRGGLTGTHDFP